MGLTESNCRRILTLVPCTDLQLHDKDINLALSYLLVGARQLVLKHRLDLATKTFYNFIFRVLFFFLYVLMIFGFKKILSLFWGTKMSWELTCDGLVSHAGGVKDSHPLNITETGDKRRRKEFTLASKYKTLRWCGVLFRGLK